MSSNVENFLLRFGFKGKEALDGIRKINAGLDKIDRKIKAISNKKINIGGRVNVPSDAQFKKLKDQLAKIDIEAKKKSAAVTKTAQEKEFEAAMKFEEKSNKAKAKVRAQEAKERARIQAKELREQKAHIRSEAALEKRRVIKQHKDQIKISRFELKNPAMRLLKDKDINVYNKLLKDYKAAVAGQDYRAVFKIESAATATSRAWRRADSQLTRMERKSDKITRNILSLSAGATVIAGIAMGMGAIINQSRQMESIRSSMLISSGSASQAKKDLKMIREEANRLGLSLQIASKSYQQIATAAQGTLTRKQTDELFKSTMSISRALNLTQDDTMGVARAFTQMLSKGTVQSEELRGQLGERLPKAYQLAATAMNMTTSELAKQLKAGRVTAKQLLPEMTDQMLKLANAGGALDASIKTVDAEINRFSLTASILADRIGQKGVNWAFKNMLKQFGHILRESKPLQEAIAIISRGFLMLSEWVLTKLIIVLNILSVAFVGLRDVISDVFGENSGDVLSTILAFAAGLWVAVKAAKALFKVLRGSKSIKMPSGSVPGAKNPVGNATKGGASKGMMNKGKSAAKAAMMNPMLRGFLFATAAIDAVKAVALDPIGYTKKFTGIVSEARSPAHNEMNSIKAKQSNTGVNVYIDGVAVANSAIVETNNIMAMSPN